MTEDTKEHLFVIHMDIHGEIGLNALLREYSYCKDCGAIYKAPNKPVRVFNANCIFCERCGYNNGEQDA